MSINKKEYNLDRKAAGRLLKLSLRTVDRHIKTKKLSTRTENGRIWLAKEEIEDFKYRQSRQGKVDNVDTSECLLSIDKDVDKVDKRAESTIGSVELIDRDYIDPPSTKKTKEGAENQVYKKLYLGLKEELNEKQERLEIANYRVGQLEAQVRNSIPMLEYHRENYESKRREESFKNRLNKQSSLIKKNSLQLKYEKFNKRIFLIILLTILALQPLWLILVYK